MIEFPNAKINIGLNVLSKRVDGFHNIETLMVPIDLTDILDLSRNNRNYKDKIEITTTGIKIEDKIENNLIYKAFQLIDADFDLPPVTVHLHKAIPMGAGLGGGSADGAYMIRVLNHYFDLELSVNKMEEYASKLGSDCPFFIKNKPAFATGRGTELSVCEFNFQGYILVLIVPPVHVNTASAYGLIKPAKPVHSIKEFYNLFPEQWKNTVVNDFEIPVFNQHPVIAEIKEKLYKNGASYTSMSGSGSSVYGLFREMPDLKKLKSNDYFLWVSTK
jgi:4-diphosphocytidyl-2-C-methyl-D-erythritol kinase